MSGHQPAQIAGADWRRSHKLTSAYFQETRSDFISLPDSRWIQQMVKRSLTYTRSLHLYYNKINKLYANRVRLNVSGFILLIYMYMTMHLSASSKIKLLGSSGRSVSILDLPFYTDER